LSSRIRLIITRQFQSCGRSSCFALQQEGSQKNPPSGLIGVIRLLSGF